MNHMRTWVPVMVIDTCVNRHVLMTTNRNGTWHICEYVCPYCHGIAMGYGMCLNRHVPIHEITGTWHIYEAQQIRCDCLKTLCKIHGLVLLIN